MPKRSSAKTGSELFIVDNSHDEWKCLRYLSEWCQFSSSLDIASAYFEIGSLLALNGEWQKVDKIRILMGDEVSRRTNKAFHQALRCITKALDESLEREKRKSHFLEGVDAIVDAIRTGKIQCKVYRKDKFHAKAYITHARAEVIGSAALVGSSNFTYPGLTENIELNVQITGAPVAVLQEWFEEHWEEAEDVSPEILRCIERHTGPYSPFEVYARSLQQYFSSHEETAGEWERSSSAIYKILAQYQREGYASLVQTARRYGGAFLCDGVGLGKTFIGLMLIERFVKHENRNVALFVPKSARETVWERQLGKRLPEVFKGYSRLKVFNHTDLLRASMQEELDQVENQADVIIIDEAHHFRNTGVRGEGAADRRSRYWRLFDIARDKQVFLLTATPVNNSLLDFQHMVELFSRLQPDHFAGAPLGIHSLAGHIRQLDKQILRELHAGALADADVDLAEAAGALKGDPLFDALVVQRSRSYVKQSLANESGQKILFPEPRQPTVANYSVKQTYGKLLDMVADAFNRQTPLFVLGIYNPYAYYKGPNPDAIPAFDRGRKGQVVSLIRTSFLKRFESSAEAFRASCWRLLQKLVAWTEVHAQTDHQKALLDRWKRKHAKLIDYTAQHDLFADEEEDEDFVTDEMREAVEKLSPDDYDVGAIIDHSLQDMEQIADFLDELEKFKPSQDTKLKELIRLLKTDPILKKHKVLIFSEFGDTARYLAKQLIDAGIDGVEQIDSASGKDRTSIIQRFSPYYNESSSPALANAGKEEIRVLIATDVLSEGLNLQDATRLINYDLHWNPVRLMQRIGRIDRRMDADIEAKLIADHPDQKSLRGTVAYWNFLPPDELNQLLSLYNRVTHKTLRISKTLGIEGGKLLTEHDDFDDLKNFMQKYEGEPSADEKMHLEWQALLAAHPSLEKTVSGFPNAVFSGKAHVSENARAVFFCYALPAHDPELSEKRGDDVWSAEAGDVRWYLLDLATNEIVEEPQRMIDLIRSTPDTPRRVAIDRIKLGDARIAVEKHISKTYLRKVQAPVGVQPELRGWMELN